MVNALLALQKHHIPAIIMMSITMTHAETEERKKEMVNALMEKEGLIYIGAMTTNYKENIG
jgi:hypothetical protein